MSDPTPTNPLAPLSDERLAELIELEQAARPAPWSVVSRNSREDCDVDCAGGEDLAAYHRGMFNRRADADFVAGIRTDAASLLAEVTRLREALNKIIEMNVRYAFDRFGDRARAESMSCVKVARAALAAAGTPTPTEE